MVKGRPIRERGRLIREKGRLIRERGRPFVKKALDQDLGSGARAMPQTHHQNDNVLHNLLCQKIMLFRSL